MEAPLLLLLDDSFRLDPDFGVAFATAAAGDDTGSGAVSLTAGAFTAATACAFTFCLACLLCIARVTHALTCHVLCICI